ncbi:MAG TPA: carbohydrate kinase family protein [Eubacteriales bacterium]|nr:carbohydrate kinase family protein [Eubacteriales bacterium]
MIMQKETCKKVLVAGTLVLDVVPVFATSTSAHERFASGGTVYLEKIQTALGGSVGNTGVALHRLGADARLFTRVGEDAFGDLAKSLLGRTGCMFTAPAVGGMNTSASVIVAPPESDRTILHSRGASQRYTATDIPEELLRENDLLHFGYPTGMTCMFEDGGETLSGLFRRAKQAGTATSMDVSFPGVDTPAALADWREILAKTLPNVDVFLPSYEELLMLLHREKYLAMRRANPDMRMEDILDEALVSKMANELLEMGAAIAVVKCGEAGAYCKTASGGRLATAGRLAPSLTAGWANREVWIAPYCAEPIRSTNGAGDTFVAGFLLGLLLGRTLEDTAALAAASAASRLESADAANGIPHYTEVEARIKDGWEQLPVPLKEWVRTGTKNLYERAREIEQR